MEFEQTIALMAALIWPSDRVATYKQAAEEAYDLYVAVRDEIYERANGIKS